MGRGDGAPGAAEQVEDVEVLDTSVCRSGIIFVCVRGVFPEPRGSQPRWQVAGGWGCIHGVPGRALFLFRRPSS